LQLSGHAQACMGVAAISKNRAEQLIELLLALGGLTL
jgi:hypothetical protein